MSDGTWRPKVVFANLTCLKLRARYNVPQNATYEDVFGGLLAATPNLKSLELCEFQAIRGKFRLPPRLTSLVLIETSIPGSDLAQIAGAAPRLEKYCTWFYDVRTQQQPQLTGDLLRPLSQLALADTLVGLSLGGSNFDKIPSDGIMRRFHALRVLGISYFSEATQHEGNRDLLIQLIKDCSQLAVLVVNGADRIGRDTLIRFATAVSRQEAPETLRKVKLIVKKYEPHLPGPRTRHSWKTLRAMAKKPVAALFRAGNVELGLHRGRREEIARWFEELGTGSEW
ncbi:hypothetical protein C8A00DRAFT_33688 [Chaetomidium leptoderma]|uniref:Uncharacterized protein n=1 Tax=Chaetomidium leptoderma TaxID=669021 RepID=A0AAN6VL60_9PEZI|nr:hypothetical protein C8A00DRAFT_33688 [Chaetomidium leptoderma]